MEGYFKELSVVGFNSAGYDIKLIKKYLFKELCKRGEEPSFTVKKFGKYPCIKTESLKFMDILQFLAPGYNLKNFFRAFGVSESKGFFSYEKFSSADMLDDTSLPPYANFWSSIKQCNVLEEEYNAYQKLLDQGKSEQEALETLRLQEVPKTGPENYAWLQGLWIENGWTTFADYLKWYNDLDVTPMIEAIEHINSFYKDKKVDFMHQAISLPGIAMSVCFNSIIDPSAEFHLFNESNKDIFQLFKNSIVGGPSIIFQREMQVGESFIRNNPNKPCKTIIGYDANALYLWSIGENMPVGYPLICRESKHYISEFPQFAAGCRDWIDWLVHECNIKILSAFHGGEKKIGKYKVDGIYGRSVFGFYGNYWHAHPDKFPDENAHHPSMKHKDGTPMTVKEIRDYDRERVQYLRDHVYNVEIMWEKDWENLLKQRPEIKSYLSLHRTCTHFQKYLTQEQIIKYIKDGHLFGFVECDIHVPEHLKDYFSEMTIIIKNTEVSLKDVGQHMQEYAKEHNIKDVPRRLLIGLYFGKKIGLAIPLLKWYLEHRLIIVFTPSLNIYLILPLNILQFKLLKHVWMVIVIKTKL